MQFKLLTLAAALAAAVSAQECAAPPAVTVTSVIYITVGATSTAIPAATPPPFPTGGPAVVPMPTGTGGLTPTGTPPPFSGAAGSLNANTVAAAIGAGLAAFALI